MRGYISSSNGEDMPTAEQAATAVEAALKRFPGIAYVTFSGNGEPTLHPQFGEIVDIVNELKKKYTPHAKSAILSNSALVSRKETREALARLDARFMKLDAGDKDTFKRFNRPHKDIRFNEVVAGLKKLENIAIQALFAGGESGNADESSIDGWIERVGEIRPLECHIYSLDRPSADNRLTIIDRDGLSNIKQKAKSRINIPVYCFDRE
jgi:wyosine [tRNA(Phe)-imidazoG37] synthetase (radical SAM superfamily)